MHYEIIGQVGIEKNGLLFQLFKHKGIKPALLALGIPAELANQIRKGIHTNGLEVVGAAVGNMLPAKLCGGDEPFH